MWQRFLPFRLSRNRICVLEGGETKKNLETGLTRLGVAVRLCRKRYFPGARAVSPLRILGASRAREIGLVESELMSIFGAGSH